MERETEENNKLRETKREKREKVGDASVREIIWERERD
jgi:hypothetical protein